MVRQLNYQPSTLTALRGFASGFEGRRPRGHLRSGTYARGGAESGCSEDLASGHLRGGGHNA